MKEQKLETALVLWESEGLQEVTNENLLKLRDVLEEEIKKRNL